MEDYKVLIEIVRNMRKCAVNSLNHRIYETFFTFANIPSLFNDITILKEINQLHNDLLTNIKFPESTLSDDINKKYFEWLIEIDENDFKNLKIFTFRADLSKIIDAFKPYLRPNKSDEYVALFFNSANKNNNFLLILVRKCVSSSSFV